jgi:hypothetical protein
MSAKYNISVLLPYNPWDVGTNDPGMTDAGVCAVPHVSALRCDLSAPRADAMAAMLKHTGAAGFNGDTLEVVRSSRACASCECCCA